MSQPGDYAKYGRTDWAKAYAKEYYKSYMRERQAKNKEYLENIRKGSKCADCGNEDHRVLQFHHRDGKEKYNVGLYTRWGLGKLKEEISKCDILCANCHIIRHYDENSGYFAQRNRTNVEK